MIAQTEIVNYYAVPGIKERQRGTIKPLLNKNKLIEIINIVSEVTDVAQKDIIGKSRKVEKVVARQIFCKICKMYVDVSLREIGSFLSNRDHSTVIHSILAINDIIDTDQDVKLMFKRVQNRVY